MHLRASEHVSNSRRNKTHSLAGEPRDARKQPKCLARCARRAGPMPCVRIQGGTLQLSR